MSVMDNVMDLMKKSLAFGLGAAALSAEKVKQFVDDMVERGEMTSEEGKRFMEDVNARADEEKKRMQSWMQEQMTKMLKQAGVAEASQLRELESRIALLENKVSKLLSKEKAEENESSEDEYYCESCGECSE